ncbi:MAG: hypothetical protein IJX93_03775, partial [Clostridia bacterium]|nr:hypothetical protein [Clostridia bacterium]
TDDERTTDFQFTVKESGMDTLPAGEYQWNVSDLREVMVLNRSSDDDAFFTIPEVKKLFAFISGTYIYSTPTYGEGYEYPGIHNYICNYYSDISALEPEEYKRIAREEFGVTDFTPLDLETWTLDDGLIHAGGIGGSWFGEVEDVTEDDTTVTVVLQLYADCNYLLKSHRIAYRFGKDGKWLGYQILVRSVYEPDGLHSVADSAQSEEYFDPDALWQTFVTDVLAPYQDYIVSTEFLDLDGNGIDELIVYDWGASANTGIEIFTIENGEVRSFYTGTNVITYGDGTGAKSLAPPSVNAVDYGFAGLPSSYSNKSDVILWFTPCTGRNGHILYSQNGSDVHTSEDYYYFTSDANGNLTVELLRSFYCEAIDSNPTKGWKCYINGEEVSVRWFRDTMGFFWQDLSVSHGVKYHDENTVSRYAELEAWMEPPLDVGALLEKNLAELRLMEGKQYRAIEAILSSDSSMLEAAMGLSEGAGKMFTGITLASWAADRISDERYHNPIRLTLEITESSSSVFPVGVSVWIVDEGPDGVTLASYENPADQ